MAEKLSRAEKKLEKRVEKIKELFERISALVPNKQWDALRKYKKAQEKVLDEIENQKKKFPNRWFPHLMHIRLFTIDPCVISDAMILECRIGKFQQIIGEAQAVFESNGKDLTSTREYNYFVENVLAPLIEERERELDKEKAEQEKRKAEQEKRERMYAEERAIEARNRKFLSSCLVDNDTIVKCRSCQSEIVIPKGIYIGHNAFEGNNTIVRVDLNGSCASRCAFMGCENLKAVVSCSSAAVSVDEDAFYCCPNLETVSFQKVSYLPNEAFSCCGELKIVSLNFDANGVIPREAFLNCSKLESVKVDNIETIEYGAFRNCKSLKKIYLPDSLKRIENYAFDGCDNLQEISFPKHTGVDLFYFPDGVKIIRR